MSSQPTSYPPYSPNRQTQSFDLHAPPARPAPPPKPGSQEVSRRGSPTAGPPLPRPPQVAETGSKYTTEYAQIGQQDPQRDEVSAQHVQDPGEQWLPKIFESKSKQDLHDVLSRPQLLAALSHSSSTAHLSTAASQQPLLAALEENISLASHLNTLEAQLVHLREQTQAQLLSTHALERQWRQKQSEMDRSLAPFAPPSLYQRLSQGIQEQELVCRALEESFLEGDGGFATEREAAEWVRRFRDAKKVYYSRRERKERWDEGRLGGWR